MGNSVSSRRRREARNLIKAIKRDDADSIRAALVVDPQLAIRRSLWRQRTPLHTAAKHGGILSISILVWAAQQIDEHTCYEMLNSADICGMTPLARAAKHGRLDIVRLLLDEGASPLIANRRGYTSLHLAALGCHHRVIDALLMATVDLGRLNGSTGSSRAYNVMIPTPFGDARYIDAASNDGFAALHLACIARSSNTVSALVARGASLDAPVMRGLDRLPFLCGGSTPLHIAAAQGDIASCLILVEAQWRYNNLELWRIRNVYGLTPLNCAVSAGNFDIVRILVASSRRSIGASRMRTRGPGRDYLTLLHTSSIPIAIRHHLHGVISRAQLLVSLRQIAKSGVVEGISHPRQTDLAGVQGLETLSAARLRRVKRLLRRQEVSLQDVMECLNETIGGSSLQRFATARLEHSEDIGVIDDDSDEVDDSEDRGRNSGLMDEEEEAARVMHEQAEHGTSISPDSSRPSYSMRVDEEVQHSPGEVSQRHNDAVPTTDNVVAGASVSAHGENPTEGSLDTAGSSSRSVDDLTLMKEKPLDSTEVGVDTNEEGCNICMDSAVQVFFSPCGHGICFLCACRLCVKASDTVLCPFCRATLSDIHPVDGGLSQRRATRRRKLVPTTDSKASSHEKAAEPCCT